MYSKILEDFLLLEESERKHRLTIGLGKENFIPDEVVATLMLSSWREAWSDGDVYAQHLILRLTRHVRAHVGKNPGWHNRGGGFEATTEEFCGDILELMIKDKAQPCHAEVAFGNYVKKRCLDCADKLYAKKRAQVNHLILMELRQRLRRIRVTVLIYSQTPQYHQKMSLYKLKSI